MVASFQVGPSNVLGRSFTSQMWGNLPETVSQDYGVPGAAASYFPGETGYGMPGDTYHSGLDVGMPSGTPLFAPVAGRIVCAGTDSGVGTDGGGCAAFASDTGGVGSGRLELQFGPGESIIFGHSADSAVRAGTDVRAGDLIGHSGSAGTGAHLHLEERVPDRLAGTRTSTGTQIVSPMNLLDGGVSGSPFGSVQGAGGSLDVARLVRDGGPFSRRVAFGVLGLGALVYGLHRMRAGKTAGPRGHSRLKTAAKLAVL